MRSTYPWIYVLFLLPVLALFPLLYLAAQASRSTAGSAARAVKPGRIVPRGVEVALAIMGALALVSLAAGALVPGMAEWLLPGPGAPLATALLWDVWHLCFLGSAFLLTLPRRGALSKGEDLEKRLLRLLVWYALVVFTVSGTLELARPTLDMPVVSLLLVLLPYGFLAVLLARAPASSRTLKMMSVTRSSIESSIRVNIR